MPFAELFRVVLIAACILLPVVPARADETSFVLDEQLFPPTGDGFSFEGKKDTPLDERLFVLPWVTLEKDTEADVLRRFGKARSIPGLERFAYCYEEAGSGVVAVLSGFRGDVVQVMLADSARRLTDARLCARVPEGTFTTTTAAGLRLGMSRDEAVRLLGAPMLETPSRLYSGQTLKIPMDPESREHYSRLQPNFTDDDAWFYEERTIIVRLDKGRVYSFTLCRVTST